MLRDPLAVQKILADHLWSKNICKTWKNSSGTTWPVSHGWPVMCVCVSVWVGECECVCACGDKRRCGVVTLKSPKKNTYPQKHISLYPQLFHSVYNQLIYRNKTLHYWNLNILYIQCNYYLVLITTQNIISYNPISAKIIPNHKIKLKSNNIKSRKIHQ